MIWKCLCRNVSTAVCIVFIRISIQLLHRVKNVIFLKFERYLEITKYPIVQALQPNLRNILPFNEALYSS